MIMASVESNNVEVIIPAISELIQPSLTNVMCPVAGCGQSFKQSSALQMHLALTHRQQTNVIYGKSSIGSKKTSKVYHCPIASCKYNSGRSFPSLYYVKQHFTKVHGEKTFACEKCHRSFGATKLLERHVRNCGMVFTCSFCSAPYATPEALQTHVYRKHTESWLIERSQQLSCGLGSTPASGIHGPVKLLKVNCPASLSPDHGTLGSAPTAVTPRMLLITVPTISTMTQTKRKLFGQSCGTQTSIINEAVKSCGIELDTYPPVKRKHASSSTDLCEGHFPEDSVSLWNSDMTTQTMHIPHLPRVVDTACQCHAQSSILTGHEATSHSIRAPIESCTDVIDGTFRGGVNTETDMTVIAAHAEASGSYEQSLLSCARLFADSFAQTGSLSETYGSADVSNNDFGTQTLFSDLFEEFTGISVELQCNIDSEALQDTVSNGDTLEAPYCSDGSAPCHLHLPQATRYTEDGDSNVEELSSLNLNMDLSDVIISNGSTSSLPNRATLIANYRYSPVLHPIQSNSDFAMQFPFKYDLNDFGTQTTVAADFDYDSLFDLTSLEQASGRSSVFLSQSSTQTDLDLLFSTMETQT